MVQSFPQLKIRLPLDVKEFIESEAVENASSQSSEIVRAIRVVMKQKNRDRLISEGEHASEA